METFDPPLIPVRMLNEFVYCPRLAILEWVDREFAHNADTMEGAVRHAAVDTAGQRVRWRARKKDEAESSDSGESPLAEGVQQIRAVEISDPILGITAKIDLVEVRGNTACPVDTKKGKRPHVPRSAYDPERVQVCAQGLLLRTQGWSCDAGQLYYMGSNERVEVPFDQELIDLTTSSIAALRAAAETPILPQPLESSPKCVRCSLAPICLPDETRNLTGSDEPPRALIPAADHCFPLYVQHPGATVRKAGDLLEVWDREERLAQVRTREISQIVLMGPANATEAVIQEILHRGIPIVHLSTGGWLYGVTDGLPHRNIQLRRQQYRLADDPAACLRIARQLVRAKLLNQRVLLRRNGGDAVAPSAIQALRNAARSALRSETLNELIGHEGIGARVYFEHFGAMLARGDSDFGAFDFEGRNRRPPRDPVNALLSFAYSMLTREWTTVCRAIGLEPFLGFMHQPRYGRPALALDLMEPFRPLVADSTVLRVINNGEIQRKDFIERMGAVNLTPTGRKKFLQAFEQRLAQEITHPVFGYRISYRRVFEVEARLFARHLEGEIPVYTPLVNR
jgi:CRISPR-associated protein Cas1